ncbi:unnamed protein product [Kuraishia capsulata CBS 1993]|uniref:AHC1-like C2H2 zinc-finger domain-containing protein n=1 Tax=Kuraishia capsulata CBS 1993 TaxID=1382522 RepID=W6MK50_9ASCO|nr:uncharacterized protein KUCA_T00000934001 [Kuraishia capsulata CBS 1993]CDK24967.1 unnamed protein product [Kuraishia capsulata CBS 1993]
MAHAMRKAQRSLSQFAPFADESVRSPLSGDEESSGRTAKSTFSEPSKSQLDGDELGEASSTHVSSDEDLVLTPREIQDEPEKEQPKIPSKEEVLRRLKDLIENEFSLEILLKHRELAMIDEEINKCEAQMIALRNHYAIQPTDKLEQEPTDFTEKYSGLLTKYDETRKSIQAIPGYEPTGDFAFDNSLESTYRTRSQTSSLRPSGAKLSHANECIYRRSDGVLVKLTCINCQRSNFSSAQGFLNHCRIAHGREFTSQDNAALICGEILPDEEQDKDGMETVVQLRADNLDPNKNLARPQIHFDNPLPPAPVSAQSTVTTSSGDAEPSTPTPDLGDVSTASSVGSNNPLKRKAKKGGLASKIPRTAEHLKLKFQNMLKGDGKFEELLTDVTTGVENPHLFEDEEEITEADRQEGEKLRKTIEDTKNVLQEAKKLNLDVDEYLKSAMERHENPNVDIEAGKPIKSRFNRGRRKSRGGVGIRRVTIIPPEEEVSSPSGGDGSKSSTPTPSLPRVKPKTEKLEPVSSPDAIESEKPNTPSEPEHYNLRSTSKRSSRVSFSAVDAAKVDSKKR